MTDKKSKPLFSIIIPMKNSEKYIKCALDSISSQSYDDYEIIVIDDDSSINDKSKDILQNWKKKHKDIVVKTFSTDESSRGPGGARNIGLDNAEGKYIIFLDSDDKINKDAVLNIYDAIKNNPNTDIFVLGYQLTRLDANENPVRTFNSNAGKLQESRFYQIGVNTAGSIWNTCIKKSLFEGRNGKTPVRFKPNCIFEDLPTKVQLFTRSKQNIKSVPHMTHTQFSRPRKSITGNLEFRDMARLINANKEIANLKEEVEDKRDKMYINVRMALVPAILSWFVSKCIRNKIDRIKNKDEIEIC